MRYAVIANRYKVSKVGIADVFQKESDDIKDYTSLIERAFNEGINYFDITMPEEGRLSQIIEDLNIRDNVFINGMISFVQHEESGLTTEKYLDRWFNDNLTKMPGGRLDSLMIDTIEDCNQSLYEEIIRGIDKRQKNGDIGILGFSSCNHGFARELADKFPQFEIVKTEYNFKNRSFEPNLNPYSGETSFVAMNPFVWYEEPFYNVNKLSEEEAEKLLKGRKISDIAAKAIRWILYNKQVSLCVSQMNNEEDLEMLIDAGTSELKVKEALELEVYRQVGEEEEKRTLFS